MNMSLLGWDIPSFVATAQQDFALIHGRGRIRWAWTMPAALIFAVVVNEYLAFVCASTFASPK